VQKNDRAGMQLLERRGGDARRVEVAVTSPVRPQHHFHAALFENSAERKAADAVGRPEPDGPLPRDPLERVLRAVDLGGCRGASGEVQVRMGPCVIADLMALVADAAREFGIALGRRAAQEEGRLHAFGAQDVEDPRRVRLGRTVVEGEQDLGLGAADQRRREQGRLRMAEAVREDADEREGRADAGGDDSQTRILHYDPSIVSIIHGCASPPRSSTPSVRIGSTSCSPRCGRWAWASSSR